MKNNIIGFIIGIILAGSIGVYASISYNASQINYKNTTLDHAMDELYTTQNTQVTNLQNQVSTLQGQIDEKNTTITNLQNKYYTLTTHYTAGSSGQVVIELSNGTTLNNYNYYKITSAAYSSATCTMQANSASTTKAYDITANTKYSFKYNNSNLYRLILKNTNSSGWCTFAVTYSVN